MEQSKNDKQEQLSDETLRKEIRLIEDTEIVKEEKGEDANPHLADKNKRVVDSLTSEDLRIFEEYKNHTLSPDKFEPHRDQILARARFMGYLGNALSDIKNIEWYDPKTYQEIQEIIKRSEESKEN